MKTTDEICRFSTDFFFQFSISGKNKKKMENGKRVRFSGKWKMASLSMHKNSHFFIIWRNYSSLSYATVTWLNKFFIIFQKFKTYFLSFLKFISRIIDYNFNIRFAYPIILQYLLSIFHISKVWKRKVNFWKKKTWNLMHFGVNVVHILAGI